jgi:hypothetical protein
MGVMVVIARRRQDRSQLLDIGDMHAPLGAHRSSNGVKDE